MTSLLLMLSALAHASWDDYFHLKEPRVELVMDSGEIPELANLTDTIPPTPALEKRDVRGILNTARSAWQLLKDGEPVVEFKTSFANALPAQSPRADSLEGWDRPRARSFRVIYENLLGMDAVEFTFRVIFTANGTSPEGGRYLANATILPVSVSALWGYDLSAWTEVAQPINVGTRREPVAALELNLIWEVSTLLSSTVASRVYLIRGDGELEEIQ